MTRRGVEGSEKITWLGLRTHEMHARVDAETQRVVLQGEMLELFSFPPTQTNSKRRSSWHSLRAICRKTSGALRQSMVPQPPTTKASPRSLSRARAAARSSAASSRNSSVAMPS